MTGRQRLPDDAAHYVTRVHRLRIGDGVVLFDPLTAVEANAELLSVGKQVDVLVGEIRAGARRGLPELQLVWGIGKGDKLEDVIRAAVALGAGTLWLAETGRSVPKLAQSSERKRERWHSIVADVMRQSERADELELRGPLPWHQVLTLSTDAAQIVLHPDAAARPLLERLQMWQPTIERPKLQLWVGPEGGFAQAELEQLLQAQAQLADLGPLILRTEIAAHAVLALASAVLRSR